MKNPKNKDSQTVIKAFRVVTKCLRCGEAFWINFEGSAPRSFLERMEVLFSQIARTHCPPRKPKLTNPKNSPKKLKK